MESCCISEKTICGLPVVITSVKLRTFMEAVIWKSGCSLIDYSSPQLKSKKGNSHEECSAWKWKVHLRSDQSQRKIGRSPLGRIGAAVARRDHQCAAERRGRRDLQSQYNRIFIKRNSKTASNGYFLSFWGQKWWGWGASFKPEILSLQSNRRHRISLKNIRFRLFCCSG